MRVPRNELIADLEMQSRWMAAEMSEHSHDKTHGYEEKWRRLHLPTADPTSVMGFMNSYWSRFHYFAHNPDFPVTTNPNLVPKALQQLGKVPNGLTDKVGMMLWRIDGHEDRYMDEAVERVLERALGSTGLTETISYSTELTLPHINQTAMGRGIESLSQSVLGGQNDLDHSLEIAVTTAVHGMFTWQAYLDELRATGLDASMPKPGEPSGEILPWSTK